MHLEILLIACYWKQSNRMNSKNKNDNIKTTKQNKTQKQRQPTTLQTPIARQISLYTVNM